MTSKVERIDKYIAHVPLVDIDVWEEIVDRVVDIYGTNLHYRCVAITQQEDALRRFFAVFPDNLTMPRRHIKYLELLVTDSPRCNQLVDWLHSKGIPTQRVFDTQGADDVGALRIFGYADPKHGQNCLTDNG